MKSVFSGPVTNHFSPFRTHSASGRIAHGGGADAPGVGSGLGLGDGVAPRSLAAQARIEVARALLGVAMDEHVVGIGHERPEAARRLAELLVDEDLLEDRPALSPVGGREGAAGQAGRDRSLAQLGAVVGRDPPAGPLQGLLPRLELLDHEAARSVAQVLLRWRQGEVHGSLVAPSIDRAGARPSVRRALRCGLGP